jgi:hypothetical protein
MTTVPPTTPKPRRRWLQFSLRTLLLLVLFVGSGMGWFVHKRKQARAQLEAAEALGLPLLHFERDWLGSLLRQDVSGDVAVVGSDSTTRGTVPALVHLRGLTGLRELYLNNTRVTDAGLVHLRGLTRLYRLSLQNTQVTDVGLVHLLGLTGLHVLSLDNTQVSDAGLTHLQGMAQLQWLDLSNTPISEAGVAQLQKALPNCRISR